jgi:hypothetical protein
MDDGRRCEDEDAQTRTGLMANARQPGTLDGDSNPSLHSSTDFAALKNTVCPTLVISIESHGVFRLPSLRRRQGAPLVGVLRGTIDPPVGGTEWLAGLPPRRLPPFKRDDPVGV